MATTKKTKARARKPRVEPPRPLTPPEEGEALRVLEREDLATASLTEVLFHAAACGGEGSPAEAVLLGVRLELHAFLEVASGNVDLLPVLDFLGRLESRLDVAAELMRRTRGGEGVARPERSA